MATPLVAGDVVNVVYGTYCASHAQQGLVRLFYKVISGSGANYESLASELYNRSLNAWTMWLPPLTRFAGVSVRCVKGAVLTPTFKYAPSTGGTGAYGTGPLPLQTSAIIRWPAAAVPAPTARPPITGRSYVPFPSVQGFDTATLKMSTEGLTRLIQLGSLFGPSVVFPGGMNLQLQIQRTPAADNIYSEVTGASFLRTYATQRRRGDLGRVNQPFAGAV